MEKETKEEKSISKDQFIDFLKDSLKTDDRGVAKRLLDLSEMDKIAEQQMRNDKDSVPKPLQTIIACTKALGWGFMLINDETELNGFILGNNDFLTKHAITKV